MRRNSNHHNYHEIRDLLKEAFKRIRKKSLYARMNFLCCGSCASYDLSQQLNKSSNKLGYVYWHNQDEEKLRNYGYTYLGYGSKDDTERSRELVGHMVVDTLKEMNIPYIWDGTSKQRILVGNYDQDNH